MRRTTFFTIQPDPRTVRKQDNYKSWTITIPTPYTSQDVEDFPLLLKFNQDNFSNFAEVFKSGNWRYLYFYDENNQPLSTELEFVNEVDNEAQVWVRVPIIYRNKDTKIKLVFNKETKNSLYIGHNEDTKADTGLLIDNTSVLDIFGDGSCIACYPFNGNTNDLSGNYNGTWSGNEQYDAGKFSQAAKFDGSSRITVSSFPYDDFTTYTNQTWSLWLKFDSGPSSNSYYIIHMGRHDTGSVSGNLFVALMLNTSNEIYIAMDHRSVNSSEAWWMSPTVIQVGRFCHIVACREQLTWKLYVNGVLKQNETASVQLRDYNKDSLYIGADDNPAEYFNGLIDQVRIFNKVLTQEEVEKLYYNEQRYFITESLALRRPHEISIKPVPKPKISQVSVLPNYIDELKENTYQIQDTTTTTNIFNDGSCIAFYKFEGNTNDETGNYNGTWSGNEQYSLGKFGKSVRLDGASFIQISPGAAITNFKSFSLWFKNSDSSSRQTILACGDLSTDSRGITLLNGSLFVHKANVGDELTISDKNYSDGQWHHLVVNDQGTIFVDDEDKNVTINQIFQWSSILLGRWAHTDDYYFIGNQDHIRFFNITLTASRVQQLYEEQKIITTSPSFVQKRRNESKIFYYKIEELQNTQIYQNFKVASSPDIKDATITKTYQQDVSVEKTLHTTTTYFDEKNQVYRRFRTVERLDTGKIHCLQDISTDGINFQLESEVCEGFYIESVVRYKTVYRLYGRDSLNNIVYTETSDFITFSSFQSTSGLPTCTSCLVYYYNSPTLGDRFKALIIDSTDETKIKLYESSDGITFTYVGDSYTTTDCIAQTTRFLSIGQYSEEPGFLLIPVTVETGSGTQEVEILQTHKAEKFGHFGLPHNFVWNDDYEYVYHCNNDLVLDSACMRDSTVNNYHATPRNSLAKSTGFLGGGINPDATYNAYLEVPTVQLPLTYSLVAYTSLALPTSDLGIYRTLYREYNSPKDYLLIADKANNSRLGYYDTNATTFIGTRCGLGRLNDETWITIVGEANQTLFYLGDTYLDSINKQAFVDIFAIGNDYAAPSDKRQSWSPYCTEFRLLNKAMTQDYLTLLTQNTKNAELINKDTPRYAFEVSVGYEDTENVLDVFNDGSCIALYRFEGNANDESGNYNGTWYGIEQYQSGRFGSGASLDGSSCIQNLGVVSVYTFSCWIKISSFPSVRYVVRGGLDNYWTLNIEGRSLCGGKARVASGTLVADNQIRLNSWMHIVGVYESLTSIRIYLDGEDKGISQIQTANVDNDQPVIGAGAVNAGDFPLVGLIDQVRLFTRPLLSNEVFVLYREKK